MSERMFPVPDAPSEADIYAASVRSEIFRAVSAGEAPDFEIHRKIVAWSASSARNTLKAMRTDLRIVDAFQQRRFRPTLPVALIDLYMLLGERAAAGHAKASISRLVASMVRLHSLVGLPPCVDDMVRMKLKEIRKADTRQTRQAKGLRLKGEVRDINADDHQPLSVEALLAHIPCDPRGLRDRALISAAYDAGLRRSEVVRIHVDHVERQPTVEGSLFIPRSKTDQEGEGARAWLSRTTIEYLDGWLEASQIKEGFVFRSLSYRVSAENRLHENAVSEILKQRVGDMLTALGDEKAPDRDEIGKIVRSISSHSLRVGCDQDLFAAGVDLGAIMQGLRWKNPKQPLAYARHLTPSSSKIGSCNAQTPMIRTSCMGWCCERMRA